MTWRESAGLQVLQGALDRDLVVRLPPGYAHDGGRRYPLLLLHDAQNLWAADGWRAAEALDALAAEGLPLIAAALPHAGVLRTTEYVGRGLEEHVARLLRAKAIVDTDFRTAPVAGVGGSSAGAYAALYAWALHPRAFGRVLALSTPLFCDPPRLRAALTPTPDPGARVWLDVGGRESDDPVRRAAYLTGHAEVAELLRPLGDRLHAEVVAEAVHDEGAWAARLPAALRFLFG